VPTYQYTCTECADRVEVVQKFTDDPLTVCDACGGRLRKVFFPAGIVFKGSGFYRTDSRNGSSSPSVAAKDKQASDSAAKDSAAKDSGSKDSAGSKPADKPAKSESTSSSSSSSSSGEKAA
jgi:putative FmdB family regulatory protein